MECRPGCLCRFSLSFCVCVCGSASDQGLFHPSWLLCVYQRMFHSENKSLMREGVCHLLELQVLQQPEFALAFSQVQAQTQFIHIIWADLWRTSALKFTLCSSVHHWPFYGCSV